MVMMTLGAVEALLGEEPRRDSVEYRNAWSTVEARLARTVDPEKRTLLQALYGRLVAIGEPEKPPPVSAEEALARARAVNEARAIGRGKAQIEARIEAAKFGRVMVADSKPFLFEAALQMIEDGEVSFQSSVTHEPTRGTTPEGGRTPVRRVWVGPKWSQSNYTCGWSSRRRQAEETKI